MKLNCLKFSLLAFAFSVVSCNNNKSDKTSTEEKGDSITTTNTTTTPTTIDTLSGIKPTKGAEIKFDSLAFDKLDDTPPAYRVDFIYKGDDSGRPKGAYVKNNDSRRLKVDYSRHLAGSEVVQTGSCTLDAGEECWIGWSCETGQYQTTCGLWYTDRFVKITPM